MRANRENHGIGRRAQMHPFVVLVTGLGTLQLVGLWDIFVGPITAAFFYVLLNILRSRLLDGQDGDLHSAARVAEAAQ